MIHTTDQGHMAGPLDAICILHNNKSDLYHAAIFEEWKPPGTMRDEEAIHNVQLVLRYHHHSGCKTHAEAKREVKELRKKLIIHDACVFDDDLIDWDGEGNLRIVKKNWLQKLQSDGHLEDDEDI